MNYNNLNRADLIHYLTSTDADEITALKQAAYKLKNELLGNKVYFRGLVEFSNICQKNCYYCGIRADNRLVQRYQLGTDEVVQAALWAYEQGWGSVVLQAGEREDDAFTNYVETVVREISAASRYELGITLSLGEQDPIVYERWRKAGASRYLLRIESSNPELYAKLHPDNHSYDRRMECLRVLREQDWMVGTGVMIGLPGQTADDLADDLLFFKKLDVDMVGMGPYVPHSQTPLGRVPFDFIPEHQLDMGLRMIALTRLLMPTVNIATATALQALKDDGREQGIMAGANVIMPNLTTTDHRRDYQLYENKPCLDEDTTKCAACIGLRLQGIGQEIARNEQGNPLHYTRRQHG